MHDRWPTIAEPSPTVCDEDFCDPKIDHGLVPVDAAQVHPNKSNFKGLNPNHVVPEAEYTR